MWLTSAESESPFPLVLSEIKPKSLLFVYLCTFWWWGLTSVRFGWRGLRDISFLQVLIESCWQNHESVSLALIKHQKIHDSAQFQARMTLVTILHGFCCTKVICASLKLDVSATRLCLMKILCSGTYHMGRAFPGRTRQQGLLLPDLVCLQCSVAEPTAMLPPQ